jgi:hypothetical protein
MFTVWMGFQVICTSFLCFQKNKECMGDIVANNKLKNGETIIMLNFTDNYKTQNLRLSQQ